MKAVGIGLSMPLNHVEVSLAPQQPAQVLVFTGDAHDSVPWWMTSLAPANGYVGALASRGSPLEVVPWQFAAEAIGM